MNIRNDIPKNSQKLSLFPYRFIVISVVSTLLLAASFLTVNRAGAILLSPNKDSLNDPALFTTGDLIYVSMQNDNTVNGVAYKDEDILLFDTTTNSWSLYFDGSDVGLGSGNYDPASFHIMPDGSIILNPVNETNFSGIGLVDDSDLLRFIPTSIGDNTAGTFELYFDGSDVGLSTDSEEILAMHILSNGHILLSTGGSPSVPGVTGANGTDILEFAPTSLGDNTAGTWSLYFDGSDVDLSGADGEGIWGLWIDESSGDIYINTKTGFDVPGASGGQSAILKCSPISLGENTACNYETYWDGADFGLDYRLDNLFVELTSAPIPPTATATPVPSNEIHINFQPASAPVPTGYLVDSGESFADRANGYTYGWDSDNTGTSRDRNNGTSPDQRYDTLLHMQYSSNPDTEWEIALPNGNYEVHLVAGDPDWLNSTYDISVEGVTTISGIPTGSTHWLEGTVIVAVADGRLTISNGSASENNKINFIDIVPITAPPTSSISITSLTLVNADTNADISTLNDGYTLDLGALPTTNLNVRANVSGSPVGSVRFELDGDPNHSLEGTAPYALFGDDDGDYYPWTPALGGHLLRAVPYTEADGGGSEGTALQVSFTVVDNTLPTPTPPGNGRVTDGLQALYTFAEGSGAVVNDVSGVSPALNLTIADTNGATWLAEGGLSIDSDNQLYSSGPATKIIDAAKSSDAVTFEAWVSPANLTQDGPARIISISADSGNRNMTLGQNGDSLSGRVRTTGTSHNGLPAIGSTAGSLTTGLHHLIFTRSSDGTRTLYIDGTAVVVDTSISGDLSNWNNTYQLSLANEFIDGRPWLGSYYLVAIYGRALSSSEVGQNFAAGIPVDAPPEPPADFPSTGTLDGFNQVDGPLSGNWSGNTANYQIVGNKLTLNSTGENDIYWNVAAFGPDQEAHVILDTIDPIDSDIGLILKSQSSNGYDDGVISVFYDLGSQVVQVWTFLDSEGWVQQGTDIPAAFAAGDRFGARATAAGQVEVYQNETLLGSRDVSTWAYSGQGGYIGLFNVDTGSIALDEFGGGTVNRSGATFRFSDPTNISNSPTASTRSCLALDSSNDPVFVWEENNDIYFRQPGGIPVNISTNASSPSQLPVVAVDKNNTIHVVWQEWFSSPTFPRVYYKNSTDGGQTWSTLVDVSENSPYTNLRPNIAIGSDNTVHIVWEAQSQTPPFPMQHVYHRMLSNNTWSSLVGVSSNGGHVTLVDIATGLSGEMHIVWGRTNDAPTLKEGEIYYSHWDGNNWGESTLLSDGNYESLHPTIAVDDVGTIHVAWHHHYLPGQDGLGEIEYTYKASNSSVWAPIEQVSDGELLSWVDPDIAANGNGDAVLVWLQNGNFVFSQRTGGTWTVTETIPSSFDSSTEMPCKLAYGNDSSLHLTFDSKINEVRDIYYTQSAAAQTILPAQMVWNAWGECPFCGTSTAVGWAGGPINTQNGNYSYQDTLLSIPVLGEELSFRYSYASQAVDTYKEEAGYDGTMGFGWTHNYYMRLHLTDTTISETVELQGPGGSRLPFYINGDGTYTPYAGVTAQLEQEGTVYKITAANQMTYLFDAEGLLIEQIDPTGNSITFTYYAGPNWLHTARQGDRYLAYQYDADARLTWVVDNIGRTVRLIYDDNRDLVNVILNPLNLTATYEYSGTSHLLTRVEDASGVTIEETAYDSEGRAYQQWDGAGNLLVDIDYSSPNNIQVNENGVSYTHQYDQRNTLVDVTYTCDDGTPGCQSNTDTNYDPNFRPELSRDENGNPTHMDWSDDGSSLESVTDALDNETVMEYDDFNNLIREVDARDNETVYRYEDPDFPTFRTSMTDALLQTTVYTPTKVTEGDTVNGLLKARQDPDGRVTTYRYNAYGEMIEIVSGANTPVAITTTYGYDGVGRLITTTISDGMDSQTKVNMYDAGDRLIAVIENVDDAANWNDPTDLQDCIFDDSARDENICTKVDYDMASRPITRTNAVGQIDLTFYDNAGRTFLTVVNYDGTPYNAQNPAAALCNFVNPDTTYNICSLTEFDNFGRPITTTDNIGRQSVLTFDSVGRIAAQILNWEDGEFEMSEPDRDLSTQYQYDPVGNTIIVTDTIGRMTRTFYDPLNRPWATVDNWNPGTLTGPEDCILTADNTQDENICTLYQYDPVGNTSIVTNTLGQMTRYFYNDRNQLEVRVDNWKNTLTTPTQCVYEADNSRQENVCTQFGYDNAGHQTTVTNSLNQTSLSMFDAAGRVYLTVENWDGTAYTPETAVADLCNFTDPDPVYNICTLTEFDDFGKAYKTTDSLGFAYINEFDGLNRLERSIANWNDGIIGPQADEDIATGYALNAIGNQIVITDTLGRMTRIFYDDLNRPITTVENWNPASLSSPADCVLAANNLSDENVCTVVEYDAAGNQRLVTNALGQTHLTVYDALDRPILEVKNWDGTAYTPATAVADLCDFINPDPETNVCTIAEYNGAGQLAATVDSVGSRTTYEYDDLNRLVEKVTNWTDGVFDELFPDEDITVQYQYDALGNTLVVTDTLGRQTRTFYNGLNRPIATVDNWREGALLSPADCVLSPSNTLDENVCQQMGYDALGNKTIMTDSVGYEHLLVYDSLNRLVLEVSNWDRTPYTSATAVTDLCDFNNPHPNTNVCFAIEFDAGSRMVATTNALGQRTVTDFDAVGRPLQTISNWQDGAFHILEPDADITTQFAYDSLGNTLIVTDTLGHRQRTFYDDLNRAITMVENWNPTSLVTPADCVYASANEQDENICTAMSYDALGNVRTQTNALNQTTLLVYDTVNRPAISVQNWSGTAITSAADCSFPPTAPDADVCTLSTYDVRGLQLTLTDALSNVTTYGYDDVGQIVTTTKMLNGQPVRTTVEYDAVGNIISRTDGRDNTIRFEYDDLNRLYTSTSEEGIVITQTHNSANWLLRTTNGLGYETVHTYDPLGRTVTTTDPEQHTTTTAYDALGNQIQMIDPEAVTTTYHYDGQNRLVQVIENDVPGNNPTVTTDVTTIYKYNALGSRVAIIDARGYTNTQTFYDDLNRPITVRNALRVDAHTAYNALGYTTVMTDANGEVTSYGYDDLNRTTAVAYLADGETVTYSYDAVGNIRVMTDTLGVTSYNYDDLYRLENVNSPLMGTVGYGYDLANNRDRITYPDNREVTYQYDGDNRMKEVHDWETGVTTYEYDTIGRLITTTLPAGMLTVNTYDKADRLIDVRQSTPADDLIARYQYTLDGLGNRTLVTETQAITIPEPVNWQEIMKIVAGDGDADDVFGYSVDISGDFAVVGAFNDEQLGIQAGAAYVFERDSNNYWNQVTKLLANDGAAGDLFGTAVAISGNTIVVGANGAANRFGSAYVFERDGNGNWNQQTRLTASNGAIFDLFGFNVAISEDTIVIAAEGYDAPNPNSGSVYIFERDANGDWLETTILTAGDAAANDSFGGSIDVNGDLIIVGAYYNDDDGTDSGSVYIFERQPNGTWSESTKLTASDATADDNFGFSVAASDDIVVVGADKDDDNGSASGSAYVFERDSNGGWLEKPKLLPGDGAALDRFGHYVSISGQTIVVAATGDDDNGAGSGSVYVFGREVSGNWAEQTKLTASDGAAGDSFGFSTAVSDNTVIVGAPNDDDLGADAGSVYFFGDPLIPISETWSETSKIVADEGVYGDSFGYSVALSEDMAVVGTSNSSSSQYTGSAYVFGRDSENNWTQQAHLTPTTSVAYPHFGFSVAISDETVVVGAYHDRNSNNVISGAAYIFIEDNNGNWIQQAKLTASDGAAYDKFGYSVAINNDTIVIGAVQDDSSAFDSGSAYIFKRQENGGWSQTAKIIPSDETANKFFGHSVAISGNTVVIGAYRDDINNNVDSGSAYIFVEDNNGNWTQQAKLTDSDGAANDNFGHSVSINEDTVVVGAWQDDDNGNNSGSAFIFHRTNGSNWNEQTKLIANDGTPDDRFGMSVTISENTAMVGAIFDDENGSFAGAVYVFKRELNDTWQLQTKLLASDGGAADSFGSSVALDGNIAIVGERSDDDIGVGFGAAYIFEHLTSYLPVTNTVTSLLTTTIAYQYDPLYRLTEANYTGDTEANYAYQYDAVGNMTFYTETVDVELTRVGRNFDAANRLLTSTVFDGPQPAGTTSYIYDANGNLLEIFPPGSEWAGRQQYIYDQRNLLTTALVHDGAAYVPVTDYVYDGNGNRRQQIDYGEPADGLPPVTTTYANDVAGLSQVLIASEGPNQVHNLFGLDLIGQYEAANLRLLLADGLGSVRTEWMDNVIASGTTYDPYGNVLKRLGNSGTAYGFTGEVHDNTTGLLYLRARYYNPALRIFMGRDAHPGNLTRPASLHGYSYANNNPINLLDPSGLCAEVGDEACWAVAERLIKEAGAATGKPVSFAKVNGSMSEYEYLMSKIGDMQTLQLNNLPDGYVTELLMRFRGTKTFHDHLETIKTTQAQDKARAEFAAQQRFSITPLWSSTVRTAEIDYNKDCIAPDETFEYVFMKYYQYQLLMLGQPSLGALWVDNNPQSVRDFLMEGALPVTMAVHDNVAAVNLHSPLGTVRAENSGHIAYRPPLKLSKEVIYGPGLHRSKLALVVEINVLVVDCQGRECLSIEWKFLPIAEENFGIVQAQHGIGSGEVEWTCCERAIQPDLTIPGSGDAARGYAWNSSQFNFGKFQAEFVAQPGSPYDEFLGDVNYWLSPWPMIDALSPD